MAIIRGANAQTRKLNGLINSLPFISAWSSSNLELNSSDGLLTARDYLREHDLTTPAVGNRPIYKSIDSNVNNMPSLTFNGISDYLYKSTPMYPLSYKSNGYLLEIHTVILPETSNNGLGFATADEGSDSNLIAVPGGNATRYFYNVWGGSNRIGKDSLGTDLTTQANVITVGQTVSTYELGLNTATPGVSMDFGSNDGKFFNNVANRDNISIGARISATPVYGAGVWVFTGITVDLTTVERVILHSSLMGIYGIS